MALFGKKKEKTEDVLKEVKLAVEQMQQQPVQEIKPLQPVKEKPEQPIQPQPKEEKPAFAPLFVKLDRYRQILNSMNYLKTTIMMVKNSLTVIDELDKLRNDSIELIKDAMTKVEKKALSLDSELIRPSGFREEIPELHDVESLSVTVEDLKSQIERLKSELQSVA